MEQLVARWTHNPQVAGSSPVLATMKEKKSNSINKVEGATVT